MLMAEMKAAVAAGVAMTKGQWREGLTPEELADLCSWAICNTDALALGGFRNELEQIRSMEDPEGFVRRIIDEEDLIPAGAFPAPEDGATGEKESTT